MSLIEIVWLVNALVIASGVILATITSNRFYRLGGLLHSCIGAVVFLHYVWDVEVIFLPFFNAVSFVIGLVIIRVRKIQ